MQPDTCRQTQRATSGIRPPPSSGFFRYVAALVPNVADAEDIVQQTALALWEKFDAYDPSQPFTPWAWRFALNKTKHWLIRKDGVLGLTAIGAGSGNYQICASPPVLALDQLGTWLHLAVVLDGNGKRVVQYVNGLQVSAKALKVNPPFRVGAAELGNWNASGFRENDPSLIRNFSGAMDEFCLFSRALNTDEIRDLYSAGKPQPDPLVQNRN